MKASEREREREGEFESFFALSFSLGAKENTFWFCFRNNFFRNFSRYLFLFQKTLKRERERERDRYSRFIIVKKDIVPERKAQKIKYIADKSNFQKKRK